MVNWTRSVVVGKLELLSLKCNINDYFEPVHLDTIDTYYNTLCRSLFGLKTVIGLQWFDILLLWMILNVLMY